MQPQGIKPYKRGAGWIIPAHSEQTDCKIMPKFFIRLAVNACALWAAAYFIDGIYLTDSFGGVLVVALVFGLVNALIKPVVAFFSFPFIILTLGLFTLVVNALMLLLTDALTSNLMVAGFGTAVLGSIVISIVSVVLSNVLGDDD